MMTPARETHGGQKLLRRADINVGAQINTFFRIKCKLSDPSTDRPAVGAVEKRHITYFGRIYGLLFLSTLILVDTV